MITILKNKKSVMIFALFVVFLFITSQIKIHMWPVPITLGCFGIYCVALMSTPFFAFLSVAVCYTMLFVSGLLVSGGMTIGYVLGFLLATPLIAYLKTRLNFNAFLSCAIGAFIILCCGTIWLNLFLPNNTSVNFGFLPFVIPEVLKITAAVFVSKLYKK